MKLRALTITIGLLLGAFFSATGNLSAQGGGKQFVLRSSHNLSTSTPGRVRATTESRVCIFCHTPHTGAPAAPLWNREASPMTYNVYSSTTKVSESDPPSATSKVCLSCHDGTIALGQTLRSGEIQVTDDTGTLLDPGARFKPTAKSRVGGSSGNNLQNDHPFSFTPKQNGMLVATAAAEHPNPAVPEIRLRKSRVECVTCHDAHRQDLDPIAGKFLVTDNRGGKLCRSCHQFSLTGDAWNLSAHKNSNKVTPTTPSHSWAGYGTVTGDACNACHLPHAATVKQRLLRAQEENTCFLCHGDAERVAATNLQAEFKKIGAEPGVTRYTHPTVEKTPSAHDAAELPAPIRGAPRAGSPAMPETSAAQPRHAECADCHNSHAANATSGSRTPPNVPSALVHVSGVNGTATDGRTPVTPALYEYQVCFVCHGDSANKPQTLDTGTTGIGYGRNAQRQTDIGNPERFNVRVEFNSSFSRHNVVHPRGGSGGGRNVPSLRPAPLNLSGTGVLPERSLAPGSTIYCTDCHNSNEARNQGGTGPNGPHGTIYQHLLARRYRTEQALGTPGRTTDKVNWVGAQETQAICNMCHTIDRAESAEAVLSDRTFLHSKHVVENGAACADCHDAHGVGNSGGSPTNHPSLINFDLSIVAPNSRGEGPRLTSTGEYKGTCNLMCHGKDHVGFQF